MKKDIPQHRVEGVSVAIAPRPDSVAEDGIELWDVLLINQREQPLRNVLITSSGYGQRDGEERRTSTLRQFFEEVPAQAAILVEPIHAEVFDLTHQYWLSFQGEDYLFDKKYIFVPGSIRTDNLVPLPYVARQGVMIS